MIVTFAVILSREKKENIDSTSNFPSSFHQLPEKFQQISFKNFLQSNLNLWEINSFEKL